MAYAFNEGFTVALSGGAIDVDPTLPVRIGVLQVNNPNAGNVFLQMFGRPASQVQVGITPPTVVFTVPPGFPLTLSISGGWRFPGSALSIAVTLTDTGSNPPVTPCRVSIVHGGA